MAKLVWVQKVPLRKKHDCDLRCINMFVDRTLSMIHGISNEHLFLICLNAQTMCPLMRAYPHSDFTHVWEDLCEHDPAEALQLTLYKESKKGMQNESGSFPQNGPGNRVRSATFTFELLEKQPQPSIRQQYQQPNKQSSKQKKTKQTASRKQGRQASHPSQPIPASKETLLNQPKQNIGLLKSKLAQTCTSATLRTYIQHHHGIPWQRQLQQRPWPPPLPWPEDHDDNNNISKISLLECFNGHNQRPKLPTRLNSLKPRLHWAPWPVAGFSSAMNLPCLDTQLVACKSPDGNFARLGKTPQVHVGYLAGFIKFLVMDFLQEKKKLRLAASIVWMSFLAFHYHVNRTNVSCHTCHKFIVLGSSPRINSFKSCRFLKNGTLRE